MLLENSCSQGHPKFHRCSTIHDNDSSCENRGQEKAELLKSLGADLVVDPTDGGLINTVKAFLKSRKLRGVDVLYDPVGGKLFKDSMKLLSWGAQILIIGFTSGEIPNIPANILLVKVSCLGKCEGVDCYCKVVICVS